MGLAQWLGNTMAKMAPFLLRKVVGLGRLVVESVVRELLRLGPATVHFQHHSDCFQALETAKKTIDSCSRLGGVDLAHLVVCLF